ncbi:hypothetical protein PVAG01_05924 [Phlyctema vagabunda]|uniref:LysM domain-containing protein n=1 Tax=Phlyctema vagabunda TaxID=108571 RepID=A0ABR4PEM5_9HELO
MVTDTIRFPVGSRVIGQAWSQIMGTGTKFEDANHPRAVVQMGNVGDVGILEVQDMLFTVLGPTAGAVVVEWNIAESSQGSAGLWDSHIRVGCAIGSKLQNEQCPKNTAKVNPNCIAASLLMHLASRSTVCFENVWAWVADHDMDKVTQDQIDIYAGRGILIESQRAWLYGTASEHSVLYQYQLSAAKNILLAMIQTESPYFQPVPRAPTPFSTGLFTNDPSFDDCKAGSGACAVSWTVRIIDSSTIYILGSGLYRWFSDYDQTCLATENCQDWGFEIEQSHDIWIYNLCTKAFVEMISPRDAVATFARDNVNGFLSSILAWLQGSNSTVGARPFEGFSLYTEASVSNLGLSASCQTALTQVVKCEDYVARLEETKYRGALGNETLTNLVCDASCGQSLATWFNSVTLSCSGASITEAVPNIIGGRVWAVWNETCLTDPASGRNCNDVIDDFTLVDSINEMPQAELCSYCYVERNQMMQRTAYSIYDERYKADLEYIHTRCATTGETEVLPPIITPDVPDDTACTSGATYTTQGGESCASIALGYSISSASLYMANQQTIGNCSSIVAGLELCLPLPCAYTYAVQVGDSCATIQSAAPSNLNLNLSFGDVRAYNPWIAFGCENLHEASTFYGPVLCLSPQNGVYNKTGPALGDTTIPNPATGYALVAVPAPAGSIVADGTTSRCGRWHQRVGAEQCVEICVQEGIPFGLFKDVNPSLAGDDCTAGLKPDTTYCVAPTYDWNMTISSEAVQRRSWF